MFRGEGGGTVVADSAERFGYPVVDIPAGAAGSAEAAVKFLVEQLARLGRLRTRDVESVCRHVLCRESQGPSCIGGGVALPHSKSDAVGRVSGVIGRSALPIPWRRGREDDTVRLVCLLVTPTSEPGKSLRALEDLARKIAGG